MNRKQYSEIQHCLGVLEGLGTALRGTAVDLFNATLARLSGIIDELAAEIGNEEGCPDEECSPKDTPPLGTVTHEEAVAMFRGIMDRAKANRESKEEEHGQE